MHVPKAYSPKFVESAFSGVRRFFGALTCFVPWRTYTRLTQEYGAIVTWPTESRVRAQDSYLPSNHPLPFHRREQGDTTVFMERSGTKHILEHADRGRRNEYVQDDRKNRGGDVPRGVRCGRYRDHTHPVH